MLKKGEEGFPESSFLLCHLADQTMVIDNVIPKWKEKGRFRGTFYPSFDGRLVGALNSFVASTPTMRAY